MSLKLSQQKCIQCEKTESILWHTTKLENEQICHECYEKEDKEIKTEILDADNENSNENDDTENNNDGNNGAIEEKKNVRKSTRSTRYKSKASSTNTTTVNKAVPKGRGRRCIFKRVPIKSPNIPAMTRTAESLFYKDSYIQVGDIVSLMDAKDNIYYAQIRGLLIDTYCEKSAFITWLIPTQASPPPNEKFDPSTYLIGPEEDSPRTLSCMEFVMHAPSNYYHDKTRPFPPPDFMDYETSSTGFLWTRLTQNQ